MRGWGRVMFVAAVAAVGIASRAFADAFIPRLPQYSLPSALYNSAVVPTNNAIDDNWAHDAEWSDHEPPLTWQKHRAGHKPRPVFFFSRPLSQ